MYNTVGTSYNRKRWRSRGPKADREGAFGERAICRELTHPIKSTVVSFGISLGLF